MQRKIEQISALPPEFRLFRRVSGDLHLVGDLQTGVEAYALQWHEGGKFLQYFFFSKAFKFDEIYQFLIRNFIDYHDLKKVVFFQFLIFYSALHFILIYTFQIHLFQKKILGDSDLTYLDTLTAR